MLSPPRVVPVPVRFALCPVRGIVFAAACVATAWLRCIVATVHGLGLRCEFEMRALTLMVFKTDRLRTHLYRMSKTYLDAISDTRHYSYIHFVHRMPYASLCLLPR